MGSREHSVKPFYFAAAGGSGKRALRRAAFALLATAVFSGGTLASAAQAADLYVPTSRSTLIKSSRAMGEVIVADPEVADVHAHGVNYLSVIGKKPGHTSVRVFDRERKLIQSYDVSVGYDLVAIRRALKNFLPDEVIGVEMVNTNLALTGQVSSAGAADKAVRIVAEFLKDSRQPAMQQAAATDPAAGLPVLNLLQVTSGQQVMLRVRVGEIQRDALKQLGVNLTALSSPGATVLRFGTGGGINSLLTAASGSAITPPVGGFVVPSDGSRGIAGATWQSGGTTLGAMIQALERDGLFKLLAEPNLVAISGEQAEFLAGGEIPIPVPQGNGATNNITIEYKPFGVAVKFRPFVLSENRIRMEVQPEVSELDSVNALTLNGFTVPAISTRRAKTTVELSPGESFMIAGLIKDQSRSSIEQLPGVKELPVLGALFRSTSFQRNETELVIAVTPYSVDPLKSADVRMPTDQFAPASQMEMIFYGALGTLSGDAQRVSQTPSAEGPIGFMVD